MFPSTSNLLRPLVNRLELANFVERDNQPLADLLRKIDHCEIVFWLNSEQMLSMITEAKKVVNNPLPPHPQPRS